MVSNSASRILAVFCVIITGCMLLNRLRLDDNDLLSKEDALESLKLTIEPDRAHAVPCIPQHPETSKVTVPLTAAPPVVAPPIVPPPVVFIPQPVQVPLSRSSPDVPVVCGKNKVSFFEKCYCDAGYYGPDCSQKYQTIFDCNCLPPVTETIRCKQLCHTSSDLGMFKSVDHELWQHVSDTEYDLWRRESLQGIPDRDDRSPEHADGFGQFSFLDFHIGKLLEVGCGPYTQTKWIARHCPGCKIDHVTLMDPNVFRYTPLNSSSYNTGQLLDIKTTLISGAVEDLDFNEVFDAVVDINVLEHVQDARLYLEKIFRALKPGGVMIFHERYYETGEDGQCVLVHYELHPVRVKQAMFTEFFSKFSKRLYFSERPTQDMISRACNEKGYYVALVK